MKKSTFDKLIKSVREAGKIRRGEIKAARVTTVEPVDVKALRTRLGLTQSELARLLKVSPATIRNWEQGRRRPRSAAQALLQVTKKNPRLVYETLGH